MLKLLIAITLMASSVWAAGHPHGPEVVPTLLTSEQVSAVMSKNPNYFFGSIAFEQSDDGWTEHTFTLVLYKYDFNIAGPRHICFWIDYDEEASSKVTRVTQFACETEEQ